MKYQELYFRSPSESAFFEDIVSVCQENGIDLYQKGIFQKIDGERHISAEATISVVNAGQWYITDPTFTKSDRELVVENEGAHGEYALINVRTKDEDLIALAESFAASDPAKDPVDIPDSERVGSGTHRIDGSMLSTPARTW